VTTSNPTTGSVAAASSPAAVEANPVNTGTPISPVDSTPAANPVAPAIAPAAAKSKTQTLKEKALGMNDTERAIITAAAKVAKDLRSKKTPDAERALAKTLSERAIFAIGMAAGNDGAGPIVPAVMARMIAASSDKRIPTEALTFALGLKVLGKATPADGAAALKSYVGLLKADVSQATLDARAKNVTLAKVFFENSGLKAYMDLWTVRFPLGKIEWYGNSLTPDRAFGLAMGRSITRNELAKATKVQLVAKAS
jgi:hypothetical protein